jgi:phage shock protein C
VNPRRLYRCQQDRRLAGVAGGLAEFLDLDPTLVRIVWVLSVFLGGFTIVAYIIMALVVPTEPPGLHQFPAWQTGPGAWQGATWQGAAAGPGAWQGTTAGSGTWQGTTTGAAWGASPSAASGEASGPAPEGAGTATGGATEPGATPGPGQYWGWQAAPQPVDHQPGRAGLYLGVLLVVFGAIAMAGTVVPGWIGWAHLGPAALIAFGVLLLVGSIRRSTVQP